MDRTPSRTLESLTVILLIALVAYSVIVVIISLGVGSVPLWVFGILIAILIVLVIVRIIAMAGFGYPPYNSTRLFGQTKEEEKKK